MKEPAPALAGRLSRYMNLVVRLYFLLHILPDGGGKRKKDKQLASIRERERGLQHGNQSVGHRRATKTNPPIKRQQQQREIKANKKIVTRETDDETQ